jgi:hypothetical protein
VAVVSHPKSPGFPSSHSDLEAYRKWTLLSCPKYSQTRHRSRPENKSSKSFIRLRKIPARNGDHTPLSRRDPVTAWLSKNPNSTPPFGPVATNFAAAYCSGVAFIKRNSSSVGIAALTPPIKTQNANNCRCPHSQLFSENNPELENSIPTPSAQTSAAPSPAPPTTFARPRSPCSTRHDSNKSAMSAPPRAADVPAHVAATSVVPR